MPQLDRSLEENGVWISLRRDQTARELLTSKEEDHSEPSHIDCVDGKPLSIVQQILKATLLIVSAGLMLIGLIGII